MENFHQEKQSLLEAIKKIKSETADKARSLVEEKDTIERVKSKIEDIEKQKRETINQNEETKEIKNAMLQKIRGKDSAIDAV